MVLYLPLLLERGWEVPILFTSSLDRDVFLFSHSSLHTVCYVRICRIRKRIALADLLPPRLNAQRQMLEQRGIDTSLDMTGQAFRDGLAP
jgi:hypothetical protein